MKRVKYLGKKKLHVDDLFRTNKAWHGHGDVQEIENDSHAKRMCDVCPEVYELVEPVEGAPRWMPLEVRDNPSFVDTLMVREHDDAMVLAKDASRFALARHANENMGLMIQDGHTKTEILGFIANIEHAMAQFHDKTAETLTPSAETGAAGEGGEEGLPAAAAGTEQVAGQDDAGEAGDVGAGVASPPGAADPPAPEPDPEPDGLQPVSVEKIEADLKAAAGVTSAEGQQSSGLQGLEDVF